MAGGPRHLHTCILGRVSTLPIYNYGSTVLGNVGRTPACCQFFGVLESVALMKPRCVCRPFSFAFLVADDAKNKRQFLFNDFS